MAEPAEQEFLRSVFLMEAWDTVAALDRAAATLGRAGGVVELFVGTQRLKGAASLHGLPKSAALAAELEDALGARPPDARKLAALAGHLRHALDAVADGAPAPARSGAGTAPAGRELPRSDIEILRAADTREPPRPATAAPTPDRPSAGAPAAARAPPTSAAPPPPAPG